MTERTREMELTVKLQVFEGPLDLLLYLLEKNKVNIYDIPIVEITEQYMEYIREMKRQDLEVLSEFLVMAATLVDIKSRMLLPSNPDSEEEEEDPREELVQQLLEYKMYKCMAYELKTGRWMPVVLCIRSRRFRRKCVRMNRRLISTN